MPHIVQLLYTRFDARWRQLSVWKCVTCWPEFLVRVSVSEWFTWTRRWVYQQWIEFKIKINIKGSLIATYGVVGWADDDEEGEPEPSYSQFLLFFYSVRNQRLIPDLHHHITAVRNSGMTEWQKASPLFSQHEIKYQVQDQDYPGQHEVENVLDASGWFLLGYPLTCDTG